jgi:acid phosphatase
MAAVAALSMLAIGVSAEAFNPLHHLGGNSPWFRGPNVFNIDPNPPAGCSIDQAAFTSRHGSRYPDPSAYNQWVTLAEKVRKNSSL